MSIVDEFHKLFYGPHVTGPGIDTLRCLWMGFVAQKNPLDLFVYQEILFDTKPDLIIETGTAQGGTALFLAQICELLDKGLVWSIDNRIQDYSQHPIHHRLKYIKADSTDENLISFIKKQRVMVILDSDHTREHVLKELYLYAPIVTPGCYMIVEDTNINGHPVAPEFGEGPYEAVEAFIKENDSFVIDKRREKYLITYNPNGYLLKVK